MLRDITIGQYYSVSSLIHRMDPRFKIIASMLYLVSLFLINQMIAYVVVIAFIGIVVKLSKVPVNFIMKGLKPVLMLIIFAFLINVFLTTGTGEPLVKF